MSREPSQSDVVRGLKAEADLRLALNQLGDLSTRHVSAWIKTLERDVGASLNALSQAAVSGIRDVKRELSIPAAVARRPGPWILGAAITGGVAGALFALDRAHISEARHSPLNATPVGVADGAVDHAMNRERRARWLLLAAEVVLGLLNPK